MSNYRLFLVTGLLLLPVLWGSTPLEAQTTNTTQALSSNEAELPHFWQDLLKQLRETKTVSATFRETRHFAMRKRPVSINGEINFSRELGLNLRYLASGRQLVMDAQGIIMRNKEGVSSTSKLPPEAAQLPNVLLALFHFDWEQMQQLFTIQGKQSEANNWLLDLTPRDDAMKKAFSAIQIEGSGVVINRIVLVQGPSQRVEIEMGEHRFNLEFSAADKERSFR